MEEMKTGSQYYKQSSSKPQEQQEPESEIELDGKPSTVAMIIGPKGAKWKKDKVDETLKKMTHLHLENKEIELI